MLKEKHKSDKILCFLVIFLIGYGLLVLASASLIKSQKTFGENYYYIKHQVLFGLLIGLGLFFLAFKVKYIFWRKISVLIFLASLILLILLFLPKIGLELGGAKRWIEIGNFVFQPSEFVKLGFIIYLATWLSRRTKDMESFSKTILPFVLLNVLLGVFFLLQPDMGSLLVIYACSFPLFLLAGAKFKHLALIAVCGLVAVLLLVQFSDYRLSRWQSFFRPAEENSLTSGYQMRQAIIGIGSGGLLGKGYGQSFQKKGYLPEVIADSVFVVLVEELGFVGGIVLIFGFLVLSFLGFRISKRAPDDFSQLLAAGITLLITYQAFINIAAISGLIPLTGLTLPLVSYGSSSYVITLFSLGILLNISSYTKELS